MSPRVAKQELLKNMEQMRDGMSCLPITIIRCSRTTCAAGTGCSQPIHCLEMDELIHKALVFDLCPQTDGLIRQSMMETIASVLLEGLRRGSQ